MRSSDASSSPFVALTIAHAAGRCDVRRSRDIADAVRWHGDRPQIARRRARRRRSGVGDNDAGKPDARQVSAVLAHRGHLAGQDSVAGPQPNVMPGVCQVDGERRAPTPRSDDADALRHAPRARSVRDNRRITLPRCRKRISTATSVAPMSTARSPGVIHSTIGSTIVATIDPSDTNRVRATTAANATAATSVGIGVEHAEHAARGRDAFTAAEPQPDRIDVTDDRRNSRGDRIATAARQQDRCRAFPDVGQHHRNRRRQPGRAIDVRGADVAAANTAQDRCRPCVCATR